MITIKQHGNGFQMRFRETGLTTFKPFTVQADTVNEMQRAISHYYGTNMEAWHNGLKINN